MARFVFKVWPTLSHYNSVFSTAKALQLKGHSVHFVGSSEMSGYVEAQGLAFTSHTEHVAFRSATTQRKNHLIGVRRRPTFRLKHRGQEYNWVTGAYAHTLETVFALKPDAILVDVHYTALALLLLKNHLNFAVFSTKLALDRLPGLPPICSGMVPKPSMFSRMQTEFAWKRYELKCRLREVLRSVGPLTNAGRERMANFANTSPHNFEIRRCLFPRILTCPEFILAPKEFDYPHESPPDQYYVGGRPDESRVDVGFDYSFRSRFAGLKKLRASGIPLVFCSLGSLAWRYPAATHFIERLIEAANGEHWRLILALGSEVPLSYFNTPPANVHLFHKVPQIDVLKECDLMITHGGMNSIKECIYAGVPMLVYPAASEIDQPGNAARVLFHRIGLRGNMKLDSVRCIRTKVRELVRSLSPEKFRVQAMSKAVHSNPCYERAADTIVCAML